MTIIMNDICLRLGEHLTCDLRAKLGLPAEAWETGEWVCPKQACLVLQPAAVHSSRGFIRRGSWGGGGAAITAAMSTPPMSAFRMGV